MRSLWTHSELRSAFFHYPASNSFEPFFATPLNRTDKFFGWREEKEFRDPHGKVCGFYGFWKGFENKIGWKKKRKRTFHLQSIIVVLGNQLQVSFTRLSQRKSDHEKRREFKGNKSLKRYAAETKLALSVEAAVWIVYRLMSWSWQRGQPCKSASSTVIFQ